MTEESWISADFHVCRDTLNLRLGGCIFISSDYYAAFKLPAFLSNDRTNIFGKTRVY